MANETVPDTARLRKLAKAARDVLVTSGDVPRTYLATFNPAVILSLLDQIDEWEATDKANADERKHLLVRIEELERELVAVHRAYERKYGARELSHE